jgi:hypothetical protein
MALASRSARHPLASKDLLPGVTHARQGPRIDGHRAPVHQERPDSERRARQGDCQRGTCRRQSVRARRFLHDRPWCQYFGAIARGRRVLQRARAVPGRRGIRAALVTTGKRRRERLGRSRVRLVGCGRKHGRWIRHRRCHRLDRHRPGRQQSGWRRRLGATRRIACAVGGLAERIRPTTWATHRTGRSRVGTGNPNGTLRA